MSYTIEQILSHHEITDPWESKLVSACLGCGSVVIAPDVMTQYLMAVVADGTDDWCCGPVHSFIPEV